MAIVVMLLLTLAVISFSLPSLFVGDDHSLSSNLSQNVRGLLGLVLIFSLYAVYQQILIKRLRSQLASQIGAAAILESRVQESERLAMADPLTGLANRRVAEDRLAAEVARSHRHDRPLTIISLDLNNLKQINDRFGHAAGDLVLKEFANRLKKATRGSDLAARMGGDEFMLILPECEPGQVQSVVSRLTELAITWHGQALPFDASAGWAEYQPHEPPEQFVERADQELYKDKRSRKKLDGPVTLRPQSREQAQG